MDEQILIDELPTVLSRGPVPIQRGRPGTAVDRIVEMYDRGDEEIQEQIFLALERILNQPVTNSIEYGEVIAAVLLIAKRAGITGLARLIHQKVVSRSLVRELGDYNDLHGRALVTLYSIGSLDLSSTWRVETAYRDFAPLVFSLYRESCADEIPTVITDVARLGFLPSALESLVLRFSALGAAELLQRCAKSVHAYNSLVVTSSFRDTIKRLNLPSVTEYGIIRHLAVGFALPHVVIVHNNDPWVESTGSLLRGLGIAVHMETPWVKIFADEFSSRTVIIVPGEVRAGGWKPERYTETAPSHPVVTVFYEHEEVPYPEPAASDVLCTVPSGLDDTQSMAILIGEAAISALLRLDWNDAPDVRPVIRASAGASGRSSLRALRELGLSR